MVRLYYVVAADFSEDLGSGEAGGTRWRRDSGSSTGTEYLPGPPDLQNNNGIGTGARVTLGVSRLLGKGEREFIESSSNA